MDRIEKTVLQVITNKWVVIACLAIVTVLILNRVSEEEHFQFSKAIQLPTGIYTLSNRYGIVSSGSFNSIPLVTTNLLTQQGTSSPFSKQWAFKRVTDGVYLIRKPRANLQGAECLYSSSDNTVRGYIVSDPAICGMDTLNYENQLDPYSIRLYFKVTEANNGMIIIQSLQNNWYLSYNGNTLSLSPVLSEECYFSISS